MMDPADRFYGAINRKDMKALADVVHPDFEMIVPQKLARGFKGRSRRSGTSSICARAIPTSR